MSESVNENLVTTFYIGTTRWGIETMKTQEVIKIPELTRVHLAPDYVEGIINLRGKIVTIISLCKKLDIPTKGLTSESRIVIVNQEDEYVGLVVDKISDVIEIDKKSLSPSPPTVNGTKGLFFDGIYHNKHLTVAILNLKMVLSLGEDE